MYDTLIIFNNSRIRLSTKIYDACDIDDCIFYSASDIIVITREWVFRRSYNADARSYTTT